MDKEMSSNYYLDTCSRYMLNILYALHDPAPRIILYGVYNFFS